MDAPKPIRLQLTVHYDGSEFHGWQLQPAHRTVQGVLQEALSRLADKPRTVIGSGRTDTGVHASGQVAAVDMPDQWAPAKLLKSLNATLPDDVWIERVREARRDFHPRFDASSRTYTYSVGLDARAASPFHRRWCWALCEEVDTDLLERAAAVLLGDHSFQSFAKTGQPERGDRCVIAESSWSTIDLGVRFSITADRYLHHMVRYLVGTMVDIARERRDLDDIGRLLANEPGLVTSPPAPPQGLFLARVEYPDTVLLPDTPPSRSTAAV